MTPTKFIITILTLVSLLSLAFVPSASAATPSKLNLPYNAHVLIMGDSYTQGVGATPMTEGWAYNLAPMGWTITRDGEGGSGYANPTTYGAGIFNERFYDHSKNSYDLIVIQGSSNDARYSKAKIAGNVNMTIRTVKNRYPSTKIVIMGPTNPYGGSYPVVNDILKRYSATYAVPFIDPTVEHWFVSGDGARYANASNGHPNNAGHQRIADKFMEDVRRL